MFFSYEPHIFLTCAIKNKTSKEHLIYDVYISVMTNRETLCFMNININKGTVFTPGKRRKEMKRYNQKTHIEHPQHTSSPPSSSWSSLFSSKLYFSTRTHSMDNKQWMSQLQPKHPQTFFPLNELMRLDNSEPTNKSKGPLTFHKLNTPRT